MPRRRVAPPLQLYAARQFSGQLLRVLLNIEAEIVQLKKTQCHATQCHAGAGQQPPPSASRAVYYVDTAGDGAQLPNGQTVYTARVVQLEQLYAQLVRYLEAIPGVLMERITRAAMQLYTEKYQQIDPGLWTLPSLWNLEAWGGAWAMGDIRF